MENGMSNPLHAAHYADGAQQHAVQVVERRELAHETYLVRIACPEMATQICPGQFLMVRKPDSAEPLLGRAFAMYDVAANESCEAAFVDIVFHIVGKMTQILSEVRPGDRLVVWGPLGNGFVPKETNHLVMVAGGIGQTPFLSLAKEYLGVADFGRAVHKAKKVTLCYGARSASYLAGVPDFEKLGVEVIISTDDGSLGHHGLVTEVLKEVLLSSNDDQRVVCCGPEKMMASVSKVCSEKNVSCQVSLETPMACGIGICFSCVTPVRQQDGSWDFKRTCVDGPVFDSTELVW